MSILSNKLVLPVYRFAGCSHPTFIVIEIFTQNNLSARGCFTWNPAIYNKTIDIHDNKNQHKT